MSEQVESETIWMNHHYIATNYRKILLSWVVNVLDGWMTVLE